MFASLILKFPRAYSLFGALVGGEGRRRFTENHVRPFPGQRILDIGCGPADILEVLPADIVYVGFDESEQYVDAARRRYAQRGEFRRARVTRELVGQYKGFDLVLALGILHHLDDAQCATLLEIAREALVPGGRFVSLDGCYLEGQSRVARYLLRRDRGKFVRSADQYLALAASVFGALEHRVYEDLMRIPYTHLVMECTR
ncbi:MAG TPA: class I SAM-dependent methyltransferase [Burkholderiales bacterium]|nr:class I SAM-dependent methyltransferase [Burkholderiales bacterium]